MKEKILVLSSSSNKEGNSAFLAKKFIEKVNLDNYEFDFIYLYDLSIDYPTNDNRMARVEDDIRNKDIRDLITKIESVQRIIIATPIWNFGVPAVLKNVLDRALTSGRVWSEEKNKKIPGWRAKKFYLLFSMGAPSIFHLVNYLGILPLYFSLIYYGAAPKIIYIAPGCGNGAKLVIDDRKYLIEKLHKKGKEIFA